MRFEQLGLSPDIVRAAGFTEPTEIQEKTIPLVLAGRDLIAQSATGSGKTFAFGSGIVQNVERGRGIQALILTPTRELALQVSDDLATYSRFKKLSIAAIYGGVGINPQIDALAEADIAVGTPGRVLDHMDRRTIDLSRVKILVLDEADRMLDMGFINDVQEIIEACGNRQQTLLFSATIYPEIARLASHYLNNPSRIDARELVDPTLLNQAYYEVTDDGKFPLLLHLLEHESSGLVMVFTNTKRRADFLARRLKEKKVDALAIHGGLTQAKRTNALEKFDNKGVGVLVCTDVASRGLDIEGVSHVYNYDIPNDYRDYTHRIGRTARAGKAGRAVSFLSSRDYDNFDAIQRNTDHKIEKLDAPIEGVQPKGPIMTPGGEQAPVQKGSKGIMAGGFNPYQRTFSGGPPRGDRRRGPSRGFRGGHGRGQDRGQGSSDRGGHSGGRPGGRGGGFRPRNRSSGRSFR